MELGGLPLHPLVVHAAVVLTPLAVALVGAFALLPRHRWWLRWPAVGTTVVALVAVWVSRLSGNALADDLPGIEQLIGTHRDRAELLSVLMVVWTVLVVAGARLLGGPSALVSGWGAQEDRAGRGSAAVVVVLVVSSLVVLGSVVLTGDSGSRAVWG